MNDKKLLFIKKAIEQGYAEAEAIELYELLKETEAEMDSTPINIIPPEHALTCATCGKIIDCRDLGQVLAHGQYNETLGIHECHEPVDVPYSSSKKVGDSVEWSKDKKPNHLN